MQTEKAIFNFRYLGKTYLAQCSKFQVVKKPQIYVAVIGGKNLETFTFYEMDAVTKELFWFKHRGEKEDVAMAIAKKLKKVDFSGN